MTNPIVSVVIPTYNRAALLREAIASVLAQDLPGMEVIVVDDGSQDDTAAVVASFGEKVRYRSQANSGLPAIGRNRGIAQARGEYVAFLDDDDRWLPGKLRAQLDQLAAHPGLGLVCCNAHVLGPGGARQGRLLQHGSSQGALLPQLLRGNFVVNSSVLCRAALLRDAGPLCEDPRLRALEDYDLWLRCAALAPIAYQDEPLLEYRTGSGSNLTRQQPRLSQAAALALIHERIGAFLDGRGLPRPRAALARSRLQAERAFYKAYAAERRWGVALPHWLRAQWLKGVGR